MFDLPHGSVSRTILSNEHGGEDVLEIRGTSVRRWLGATHEHSRREQLGMAREPHDIVVAGNEPRRVSGIPVDGVLLPQAAEIGIGVVDDLRRKQIIMHGGCPLPRKLHDTN
jgi:hypothetical protein